MQSILENLYCGNIGFDAGHYGQDSPFVRAARVKHDSLEKLLATLNESEKELFEKYCEAQGEIEGITNYDTFTSTLIFGVLFMVEIFTAQNETGKGRES